jgi:pimeloyl-ACP methyl ester carboxylesterase
MSGPKISKSTIPFDTTGGGARAVIFVHGFLDAGAIWRPVIERMASQSVQTVTLDLPGMGALHSDTGKISLDRYASDVGSVLQALGKPAILVGQSMGAQVVELVAAANPALVAGLVLVTPVPLDGVKAPAEVIAPFKKLGHQPEAQRQTRKQLSYALSDGNTDILGGFGDLVAPPVVAALVNAWNDGHPAGGAQSHFAGPVLLIRGAQDPFVTESMADAIAARFSNVRQEAIEEAGHWAHVEQPKRVAALLDGFVAETVRPAKSVSDPAGDWKGAFAERSATAFADAFANDVVLEASTLNTPVVGRENVKRVMEAASKLYESLVFTAQAADGQRQYVEWTARAFNGVVLNGVTVITRNENGAIARVAIHHRPLEGALLFSHWLGEHLRDVIDPSHFLSASNLPSVTRS